MGALRGIHRVQNILSFVSVLIAEDGVGEFLSIAGRAAVVDVQRGPSASRVDLIPKIKCRAILGVRPAMNIDDERMFGRGGHPQRLCEKGPDLELGFVAYAPERRT